MSVPSVQFYDETECLEVEAFLVERIYEAGHAQLMKIRWVAVILDAVTRIRQAVIAWARGTAVWAAARAVAARVRAWRLSVVEALRALRSPSS